MFAMRRTSWFTTERAALAGLLVVTLFVRGGVLWAMRGNLQQDPDAYREIAENLLRYGEFALGDNEPEGRWGRRIRPTAYRPPLYPTVLSNLPADGQQISLVKVALLHLLLGVATVWLTWITANRLMAGARGPEGRQVVAPIVRSGIGQEEKMLSRSGGPAPGGATSGAGPPGLLLAPLVAALLVGCDPILLNQQTLVMTETLAAFLAILSLWCLVRFDDRREWFNAALAGAAIGLSVLCRPTFLPWLPFVGLGIFTFRGVSAEHRVGNAELSEAKRSWWSGSGWRMANAFALVVGAAAVISPWAIRNYRVFGEPIVTTTHGGYTLFLANNASFYRWLQTPDKTLPWNSSEFEMDPFENTRLSSPGASELSQNESDYRSAQERIREQPGDFFWACLYRIRQLWSPLPYKLTTDESIGRTMLRYATAAWYCGVYVLAAMGIWRLRWRLLRPPWIWGVLLCLAFTAVHTLYWTNLRMRAPLMPFVAIVAAAAFVYSPTSRSGPEGAK